jgi:hypothetical protein
MNLVMMRQCLRSAIIWWQFLVNQGRKIFTLNQKGCSNFCAGCFARLLLHLKIQTQKLWTFYFWRSMGILTQVSFSFHNTPILTSRNSHTKIHWAGTIHVFSMEDHTYCTWWSQAGSSNQITMQTIGWGSQSICNKISEAYRSNIRACKAWQNLHKLCRCGYGVSFDKIMM